MANKERKALGTGLSALFGSETLEDENVTTLPLSKIEPRTQQPREVFEEDALQTLAESIARYGVIQPITVRPLSSGFYQIIAGERRWRASRLAGLMEVPVRILQVDDRTTAELALVENLQREDLNPIEEAKGYQTLMEDYGLTQEETAKSVGKSRPAIANALRLLTLSPAVLKLVENGDLSAGHARALVSVQDPAVQLEAANEIMAKALSVRKAEQLAARTVKRNTQTALPEKQSRNNEIDYAKEVSAELSKKLGRRVTLFSGKTGGKIELDYYSDDDREVLIDLLRSLSVRK
ncbi:MAG: ParB/RepB/Spo0J family partition protein [Oscillospiraceae bacterium]|nr:ParB/RepB/Spo0J family partition protein [Oscillospiraceae bacterium]